MALGNPRQNESVVRKKTNPESKGFYGTAGGEELWLRFAQAATSREFYASWLAIQCQILERVRCGLILIGPPDQGPFTPAGVWPDSGVDVTHLAATAEKALKERRGLLVRSDRFGRAEPAREDTYHIAYPVEIADKLYGAAVMEIEAAPNPVLQSAMRKLHWGAAWLEVMVRRQDAYLAGESEKRLHCVLDSVATVLEHDRFHQGAMAFVTQLATTLNCTRVSLGFTRGGEIKVQALSHSAGFGSKMNLLRAIGSAMDEALDQKTFIVYPLPEDAPPIAAIAHEALAGRTGSGLICTVPVIHKEKGIGAVMFERDPDMPFDEGTLELLKTIGAIAGPLLDTKRKEERSIWSKIWESLAQGIGKLTGPEHPGLKLAGAAALAILLFLIFATGDHRVGAPTVLEGIVQRVVTAPFDGYVAEAPARPGDVLKTGQLLCRLDDRDLHLERLKWSTQRNQLMKQHAEAMAKHERAQVMILQSRIDQADAEIRLLDEHIARSKIAAPFDGIVTSGDLSQSLGSPVERGQILFEIAPLQGYRVIVQVDERDIGYVAVGQKGELILPSLPGQILPLEISKITPVFTAKEGRNYFNVEARLEEASPGLRPGMEGVGKITIDRKRLFWIWAHESLEWIRLKLWTWLP
jgi:multidrug resistance efflux pump